MAKKRNRQTPKKQTPTEEKNSLFSDDMLAKLKEAKTELQQQERQIEEEKEAQRMFEREQREKNLSFGELLDRYDKQGGKF